MSVYGLMKDIVGSEYISNGDYILESNSKGIQVTMPHYG